MTTAPPPLRARTGSKARIIDRVPKKVGVHLPAASLVCVGGKRGGAGGDARVVDEQHHVAAPFGHRSDLGGGGDVEPYGDHAVERDGIGIAGGGVDFGRPPFDELPGECAAEAAVGAGDERNRSLLLVVRELRFGHTRFKDIVASTGAPRDVLTSRLRKLEQAGVIERHAYSERPRRYEYGLTESGRALHPTLLALKEWGDRYCNPGAEPVVFGHTCGAEFHPVTVCAACQEPVRDGELTVTGGTHPVEAIL